MLVAFSGGVDSALVLAAAVRALGTSCVVAATAVSPSLPAAELVAARAFAASLGVEHLTPSTFEGLRPGYVANAGDRCFHCKAELLDVLGPLAAARGMVVATGTNATDALDPHRPGMRAAAERGAVTPLADVGMTKGDVRALAREWGLGVWDKPQAACLASRIRTGLEVTPARLARVEVAEALLRVALPGVRDLRVRDLGSTASIEVDLAFVAAAEGVKHLVPGFETVVVDPAGFRSGSLHALPLL